MSKILDDNNVEMQFAYLTSKINWNAIIAYEKIMNPDWHTFEIQDMIDIILDLVNEVVSSFREKPSLYEASTGNFIAEIDREGNLGLKYVISKADFSDFEM